MLRDTGCTVSAETILFGPSEFKVQGSVFVRVVAFRALDIALPLRVAPLLLRRIVNERSILIRERRITGLASYKPALHHREICSRFGSNSTPFKSGRIKTAGALWVIGKSAPAAVTGF